MSAIEDIAAERQRQIEKEGWTIEHDDEHGNGQLAQAAIVYAANASWPGFVFERNPWWSLWPWDLSWWKPKDKRRDLIRAGALIVAEIERLDRASSVIRTGETNGK